MTIPSSPSLSTAPEATAATESTKAALAEAVTEAPTAEALSEATPNTTAAEPIAPTTAIETAEPVLAGAARLLFAVRPRRVTPSGLPAARRALLPTAAGVLVHIAVDVGIVIVIDSRRTERV